MNFSETDLRKYLLRLMAPQEMESVEFELIKDSRFEIDLRKAEDALIADYIDKNLSAEEENLFFENFLTSRSRFESVRQIRLLRSISSKHPANSPTEIVQKGDSASRLISLLALDQRPSLFVLGVLLVIFVSILIWQIGLSGSKINNNNLHSMLSRQSALDLSDLHDFAAYSSLNLYADGHKFDNNGARFKIGGLSKEILLRLALPPEATSEKCFSLEIEVGDGQKVSLSTLKAYSNDAGSEIRILVPREMAERRDCQLILTGKGQKKPKLKYRLRLD